MLATKRKINVYCGWWRNTIAKRKPEIVSDIALTIPCLECGGSGIWNYYPDDWREVPGQDNICVDCKGTGREYLGL